MFLQDGLKTIVFMKALRRVVFCQLIACLICTVAALAIGGSAAAVSSLLGGAVCALPSFLVIFLMYLTRNRAASPLGVFVFEFIKVSLVILGFLSVALFYKELNWLAFILSAGVVLLSHVFALASRE